ncbi:MAG: trimeric autotransporter adhesin, partial [Acidobacteriota bacterium]|nr:trimeric autotransporter adhesin [Acidobacteriota bacterium]
MRLKHVLKLSLLLFVLLCLSNVAAQAFTITRTSLPKFYIDSGANLRGMYVSYQILNNSGTNYPDVWVGVDTFTGGVVSLASGEDGVVHLGAMAPGQMKTAYFYLQASGGTTVDQSHTVRVYTSRPPTSQIDSATFIMTDVEETIQANANKITTTVSGPNPPGLGGIVTVQVTGHSGTIGSQNLLSFTPASELDWIADNYQLLTTSIVLTGGNSGTYNDRLFISGLASSSDTNYVVTYSFRATGVSIAPQRVTPMVYIASGTNIKHTQGDPATISTPVNGLTLSKLVNPSQVYVGGTVTYTLRLNNSGGPYDTTVDDLVDTLPTSPGSPTYVTGSSTYNGAAIANPAISGSTLTWVGSFVVPAGQTRDLTFQATFPNTAGTYPNSAVGHIGSTQVDTTLSTSDNSPATVNTIVVTRPDLTIGKSHSGNFTQGQSGATYTITATNSGGSSTVGTVTVTDTLPASLTYVSAVGTGWSCSAAGQTVTCTSSTVVAAASSFPAITLTVDVSATAPASITNSVSVSGGGETNAGNNSASDATTINQIADMTVAKSHTGNFTRGSNGSYTITATNSGTGA